MNNCTIIGNLTADPDLRTTTQGNNVCEFRVAVNRRKTQNNPDPGADFFKVTVWNERADLCAKYLQKGKKVAVEGSVTASAYTGNDGQPRASLEIKDVKTVEFLSPAGQVERPAEVKDEQTGFTQVETDDLPF